MNPDTRINIDDGIKFILTVKIYIRPEQVDEFFTHFKPAYEAVVAEPQCRYFVVGQDPQTPGAIYWCEGWTESLEWFQNVSRLLLEGRIQFFAEMTARLGSVWSS